MLPHDFSAPIFLVVHVSPRHRSVLPAVLARATALQVKHAEHGETPAAGTVYIAPPDQHLIVRPAGIALSRGPRESSHRPSVDTLFRTAAAAFGPRVAGIVLSGALDDGTAGLTAVKRQGGVAIVQEPSTALHSGMPQSAIDHVDVDYVVPLTEIAPLMLRLAAGPVDGSAGGVPDDIAYEVDMAALEMVAVEADYAGRPERKAPK